MSDDIYERSIPIMGTIATIQVIGCGNDPEQRHHRQQVVQSAFSWFERVETCCSRFEPRSELTQLTAHVGVAHPASEILYEAVQFSLAVAEQTGGAFDPTVGYAMESRGFNREYRSGKTICTQINAEKAVSYRDVRVDPAHRTITLLQPLIIDLGAIAKGLAIDLAARELREFGNFAINAGGDLYARGHNLKSEAWSIGIRHPRQDRELIETLRVSNCAVCTSGGYERMNRDGDHHILNALAGEPADKTASATVIAPTAMLADALSTAAFVLGPETGIQLLESLGVEGLLFSPTLERHATRGFCNGR